VYYYRARYYHPQFQRFISEDPIGFAGGINAYAYVGNAPLRWVDPLGLDRTQPCLDEARLTLDIAGLVPVIGEPFDLASGVLSLACGDTLGAVLSAGALIPGAGDIPGAVKVARGAKRLAEYHKHVANLEKAKKDLDALKAALDAAKGPKRTRPLQEQIKQVEKEIRGHEKEIRQKWPAGAPTE
jgi:hypothetical protein